MTGLLSFLDDVAALAKLAAVRIDDVASQTSRAGVKIAGSVIDDAANELIGAYRNVHDKARYTPSRSMFRELVAVDQPRKSALEFAPPNPHVGLVGKKSPTNGGKRWVSLRAPRTTSRR